MRTVEQMKNEVVNMFGLDSENTAKFFKVCEYRYAKKLITGTYKALVKEYERIINEE